MDRKEIQSLKVAMENIQGFIQNYGPNIATVSARRADYMMFLLSMQNNGLINTQTEANEVKVLIDLLHDKLDKIIRNKSLIEVK